MSYLLFPFITKKKPDRIRQHHGTNERARPINHSIDRTHSRRTILLRSTVKKRFDAVLSSTRAAVPATVPALPSPAGAYHELTFYVVVNDAVTQHAKNP